MATEDHPLTPLLNALQAALVPPTRAAAALPSPADLSFERSLSRKLARSLDAQHDRILALASQVLAWASPGADAFDADLVREGVYNPTTLRLEPLLEAADDAVDRHRGTGKHASKSGPGAAGAKTADEMRDKERERAKRERLPARLLHDSTREKPQTRFSERCVMKRPALGEEDGAATVPEGEEAQGFEGIPLWKPLLRRKVNALDEGAAWLTTEVCAPSSSYTLTTHTSPPRYIRYTHPYAAELSALSPPPSLLVKPSKPAPHAKDSFEKTPFEWVETEEALGRMVDEIRAVGEQGEGMKDLAIDLEHHDFRTWGGVTCLMQLSTRKKDYVIDVLNPGVRDNLDSLNEFFTDPNWIKVLHGASSDIIWLQRDFGLYIVGLFDTYHATKVLGYAQHSLASLLDMYTDFEPDKRYQLADWRIRPLPKEMLHYARSDTHYLLSIYDHLRLALHHKSHTSPPDASSPSHLEDVFARSTHVASSTFSLAPFDAETGFGDSSFLPLLAKHGQLKAYATALAVPTLPIKTGWGPTESKFQVLQAVCVWREKVAREEDESVRYVLGQGGVWQLAELGGVGRVVGERDVMAVLGAARGGVSEVVRRRKDELAAVVVAAYESATGAEKKDGPGSGAGEEDVEMAPSTSTTIMQLGLPAEEPTVRPVQGLWDAASVVASTSTAIAGPSVKLAPGSAFYGSSSSTISPASSASFASPSVATASSSSFFGTSSTSPSSSSSISASATAKSKGKGKGKGKAAPRQTAADRAAAVSRVHASLVLGGGLAQSLSAHIIPSAAPVETDLPLEDEPLSEDQPLEQTASTDHTYVPLSGRVPKEEKPSSLDPSSRAPAYSKPEKRDRNEVIVVSAMKDKGSGGAGKKRKRVAAAAAGAASTSGSTSTDSLALTTAGTAATEAEIASPPPQPVKKPKLKKTDRAALAASLTPHDYSSTPSILDSTSVGATGRQRREMEKREKKTAQREEKGKKEREGVDTSAFGRAPRVNNAPKKANRSHVFGS
ncbi:hypothetical protein JCM11251_001059 [Rhodosporidiobolus azoricus]